MSYIADPTNTTQPTEDVDLETAAAEFRALKTYVRDEVLVPVLAAEAIANSVGDRLTALEGSALLMNPRGEWATATAYVYTAGVRRDWFTKDGVGYLVAVSHTSGVFLDDETAGKFFDADAATVAIDVATKVSLTGNETIAGVKTFSSSPVVPAGAEGEEVPQAQEVGSLANVQLGIVGQVATFAMNSAPTGWLKANGALVSRTTYAALFAAVGTTFGVGDGSTTFALPDLRGEFIRGWDDGRGIDTGRVFGSAQSDQFKNHAHPQIGGRDGIPVNPGSQVNNYTDASGSNATSSSFNNTSTTGGTETRPRNIALLACIKY